MNKRLKIICGHYGSGKTNLAINLALKEKKQKKDVKIVDLDIVNPYFRTADYTEFLLKNGIEVISPSLAGSTVDAPALTAKIASAFMPGQGSVIIDVGGDDVGATALGRYAKGLQSSDYEMIYVINKYRIQISAPEDAVAVMKEIELASKLKVTALVNNSHLCNMTKAEDISAAVEYAKRTSALAGIPLMNTTCPADIADELCGKIENLFPVEIIVKLPW